MQTLILKKTDKGLEALRARDPALPQRLRPAFIMFDGSKSIEQVMALLPASNGRLQVLEDIKLLVQQGLLELLRPAPASEVTGWLASPVNPASEPQLLEDTVQAEVEAPHATPAPQPLSREERHAASRHASAPVQVSDPTDRYMKAYAVASVLVSELGLRGFRLQLMLEKAQGYQGLVALLPRMRDLIDAKKLRAVEKILLAPDEVSVPASNAPSPAIIP
ncbi:hypothetical protein ACFIQF_14860 [Comamonas sp. J-3]|uniref:hypothetical protein n=1 Tax=Comamonas trifloxystrobinivorans TaxID=3350256 RepID=UPI003726A0A3